LKQQCGSKVGSKLAMCVVEGNFVQADWKITCIMRRIFAAPL
jgi:hypothetical protein